MSKRPLVLLPVLFALAAGLAGYRTYDRWYPAVSLWWEMRQNPPLPGENRVGNIKLAQKSDALWIATFDYYFVGYPKSAQVVLLVDAQIRKDGNAQPRPIWSGRFAERGQHSVTVELRNPGFGNVLAWAESAVAMIAVLDDSPPVGVPLTLSRRIPAGAPFTRVTQHIEWPDEETIQARPENVLKRAVALIDSEQPQAIREAGVMLQTLLARMPAFDPAYVELARVAMKTQGPAGLPQAEQLIQSALQIRPDSVDARILLAYVYGHQKRYAEAEALNKQLEQQAPDNLWLLTNMGELARLQGHDDVAIAKYREVLAHPPTQDKYDRARHWTYEMLLQLLWDRKDMDGVEALYRQRVADYKEASCTSAHLAQFLLMVRGDADGAIATMRAAPEGGCGDELGRKVLGLAHYVKWATGPEEQRAESLRQARVFMPPGPLVFYHLAASEATAPVARKLVTAGDNINAQNAEHLDALTYALRGRDYPAASRLLRLGARTDSLVGDEQIPVSLVPVLMQDVEGVTLLRRAGVDYSRVRFRGATATDFARSVGNAQLLRALEPKGDGRGSSRA